MHCTDTYLACFPPEDEDVLSQAGAEDAAYARDLRLNGWLPTKAFKPPCRVHGPLLPCAGSQGAHEMFAKWVPRSGSASQSLEALDGFYRIQDHVRMVPP